MRLAKCLPLPTIRRTWTVRQWIQVAHDLGARYAVLTAKHMSGFCLWDSKGYDYDVAASGNKTDVVDSITAFSIPTMKANSIGTRACPTRTTN